MPIIGASVSSLMRPLQDNPLALVVGGLLLLAASVALGLRWLALMALLLPAAAAAVGLHRRRLAGLAAWVERVADRDPGDLPDRASPHRADPLHARLIHAVECLSRRARASGAAHRRALADAERLAGEVRERDARLRQLGDKALDTIASMHALLLEAELEQAQRRRASADAESALGLLTIVNQGLDHAQLDSQGVGARLRVCDPEVIVRRVLELLAARAHARGVVLTVLCDPAVPTGVATDPSLLRQILLNLVAHAVGCATEAGVQVRLCRDSSRESLRIAVVAPGAGLAREAQPALLGEAATGAGHGGRAQDSAGLALLVSRRLARVLGGDLGLEGKADEDSCLSLTLPLPAAVPDGERAAAAVPLAGWRVALWADHAALAAALMAQLRALGVVVDGSPPSSALPAGCCGVVQLTQADRPEQIRRIGLHRWGGGCGNGADSEDFVASVRLPVTPTALVAALCQAASPPTPAAAAATADGLIERVGRCAVDALPILLAEDSPANQLVATNMLEKAGFRVDVVENGRQAVIAAEQRAYAVVLMDLAMPEMDGLEATGCIRALPGRRGRVPIVAMTAYALDDDRRRCLEAGMDGYLSKPIDRRKLLEALLEWADGGRTERLPEGAAAPVTAVPAAADTAAAAGTGVVEAEDGRADAAAPILDEAVAGALARDLSDALMPPVVATFAGEVRERILAIEQAAAAGDSARAGAQGHALKGSAATFGAAALHARALAIERAGHAGRIDEVRALAAGLGACGEAVVEVLERRWGGVDSVERSTPP